MINNKKYIWIITYLLGFTLMHCNNGSGQTDAFSDAGSDSGVDTDTGPKLLWAISAGGNEETYVTKVAVDEEGSVVVTGAFSGSATFGSGESSVSYTASDKLDMFVAKYDGSGEFLWSLPSDGQARGRDVRIAKDGSIYVVGEFGGTMTIGKGDNSVSLVASSDNSYDIFVAKYTPAGKLDWAQKAGGIGTDEGRGLVVFPDNSILVVGLFSDVAEFGEGVNTISLAIAPEDSDVSDGMFIAHYMPDGTIAWAKTVATSTWSVEPWAMDISQSDSSVVVTGQFVDFTIFGNGENSATFDQYAPFLAKYDLAGQLIWVHILDTGLDSGGNITVSPNNSIYQTGNTDGTPLPDASRTEDISISKRDPQGTLLWHEKAGLNDGLNYGLGICTLPNETIIITGFFEGTAAFGTGNNEIQLFAGDGSHGSSYNNDLYTGDIFIANYDTDGNLVWAEEMGSHDSHDSGYDVTCFPDGTFVVAGAFGKTLQLGNDSNSVSLTAPGETSMFLAKYSLE